MGLPNKKRIRKEKKERKKKEEGKFSVIFLS